MERKKRQKQWTELIHLILLLFSFIIFTNSINLEMYDNKSPPNESSQIVMNMFEFPPTKNHYETVLIIKWKLLFLSIGPSYDWIIWNSCICVFCYILKCKNRDIVFFCFRYHWFCSFCERIGERWTVCVRNNRIKKIK